MSFATGCMCGTIYYFSYGCFIAPKEQRMITALKQIRDRSTNLGGSIALWSGTFTFSKGILSYIRQKDDRYNPTFGGFITGLLSYVRANLTQGLM